MTGAAQQTAHLQGIAAQVFVDVIRSLEEGMSELDISEAIKSTFAKSGIEEYWYNVPRNVLIGADRFIIGTTTTDYAVKAPSPSAKLTKGSPVFIDLSPIDPLTKQWGDWSSTFVFRPRKGIDDEQVAFLEEMRSIHRKGMARITVQTTGAEVIAYYLEIFKRKGIELLDVRKNVGHSIHAGPKDEAERIWLDEENTKPLGEGVFAIEPGGSRLAKDGRRKLFARFEECVYVPKTGTAILLGSQQSAPLSV